MTILLRSTFVVLISVLTVSACQTADLSQQTSQTIKMPNVTMNLDSDGDGVTDDLDQCPATPFNVIVDEKGCPPSLLFGKNEFRMEARAYYDENSSEIKSEYYEQLDNAGKKMQDHLDAVMRVEGHMSEREETSGNQTLSRYRVEGIKNYMTMKHNIDPERIKAFYYGSERPIAPNDAGDSWLNQRIYAIISNVE